MRIFKVIMDLVNEDLNFKIEKSEEDGEYIYSLIVYDKKEPIRIATINLNEEQFDDLLSLFKQVQKQKIEIIVPLAI